MMSYMNLVALPAVSLTRVIVQPTTPFVFLISRVQDLHLLTPLDVATEIYYHHHLGYAYSSKEFVRRRRAR
jgi:hypothetical protein